MNNKKPINIGITISRTVKGYQAQTNTNKVVIQTGNTIKDALANLHYAYIGAPNNNIGLSKDWAASITLPDPVDNVITLSVTL